MTEAIPATGRLETADTPAERWLPLAMAWQGLLGLFGVSAALLLWLRPATLDAPELLRSGLIALLVLFGIVSLVALPLIQRRHHHGRLIALVTNYLGFLVTLVLTLHRVGVFIGIDNLANTFPRGLPFLALLFVGWLIVGKGEDYSYNPPVARRLRQAGYALMTISAVLFLFAVGLVPGLLAILRNLLAQSLHLFLGISLLLSGIATWYWWQNRTGLLFGVTISQTEMLNGYLLLSPNLLGFLIFFAGPLLFSLYVSFTEWSAFGAPDWIGLGNYGQIFSFDFAALAHPTQRASEALAPRFSELTRFSIFGNHYIIGARDKLFWIALRNTFTFTLLVVPLSVLPALVLANILNSKVPGMRFFRAIYFLPSVAAVVGIAVIWNWLYNSTVGFINYGITNLINLINALPWVTLTDPQLRWLSSSDTALLAIVIMSAWRIVGFNTVLFLAGLQGIPGEIYEAAEVDGADTWRKFRSITIPLLAPTTFFVTTTTIIQALQLFDEVFVLMNPPAGPNNATLTAVLYLYQNGFQRFNLGYASAVAWALFIIIFVVTLVQFRIQRSNEGVY